MTCQFKCKTCGKKTYLCKATNPKKKILDPSLCETPEECSLYRLRMRTEDE